MLKEVEGGPALGWLMGTERLMAPAGHPIMPAPAQVNGVLLPSSGSSVKAESIPSQCESSWGGTQEACGPLQAHRQERVAPTLPLGDISREVGVW